MKFSQQRRSLLSDQARIQVPWICVRIGTYTFGIAQKPSADVLKGNVGKSPYYNIQYPNYVQSLSITKINGQVNQYTLQIKYPVTQFDDPNFFEKVFSSVSNTREIEFSYGDISMPNYIYKCEKALITSVTQTFDIRGSVISYIVNAVSGAALKTVGCITRLGGRYKPSDIIKDLLLDPATGLADVFTGMTNSQSPSTREHLSEFIAGDDQEVMLDSKINVSALDYIQYLVSCMIPVGAEISAINKDIYVLTVHDDTVYDSLYNGTENIYGGPYFKVTKTSYVSEQSDAYELDIGYNTSTIVSDFSIENNENYSLYYEYQKDINSREYVTRLNESGEWEEIYAPTTTSNNMRFETRASDRVWWTKITQYPINASITIQGLLRPAMLMQYLRLNVIFPGGHKHISSGLYIITRQHDEINDSGYKTTLSLTKIKGEDGSKLPTNPSASYDKELSKGIYERTRFYNGNIYDKNKQ